MGIEPTTTTLATWYSTAELHPLTSACFFAGRELSNFISPRQAIEVQLMTRRRETRKIPHSDASRKHENAEPLPDSQKNAGGSILIS